MSKIKCQSSESAQKKAKKYFKNKEDYEAELFKEQKALLNLQQTLLKNKKKLIIVLEGSDTAGKGGAIRRMSQYLDARTFHVHGIGKPTPEEMSEHYLQRFFSRLPKAGEISVFDRSWYGRVLVERVEKLTKENVWKRAYTEINNFEKMLSDDGIVILKYFLDISHKEQGLRFKERENDPMKSWKMTDEDYRNRKKWNSYQKAFKDMIKLTSTKSNPWIVVPADSKWFSRVHIIRDIVKKLS